MITVKKGQKKQTTKTINESTCERRSACYLVIMILMSLSIFIMMFAFILASYSDVLKVDVPVEFHRIKEVKGGT